MTAPVSTTAVKNPGPAKTEVRSKERTPRGRAKDPASRILELQRVVGNRAVNQIIQPGNGFPLALDVRSFMEERFQYDFSRVRIHTDRRAASLSHALGAQAYTVGNNIVFGAGQYDPSTITGRTLLAHELAHVVQANGHIPSRFDVTPAADATEIQAERAALTVAEGGHALVSRGKPAAIRLRRDPDLTTRLEKLEAFGGHPEEIGFSVSEVIDSIFAMLRGIDLGDPDNLQPITETISKYYPRSVLSGFLQRIEDAHRARKAAAEARHQSAMRLMQVQRRGPYGTLGPGVAVPVIAGVFKPLLDLWEAIEYAYKSAGAFIRGLVEGFSKSVSEDQARKLSERLLESAVLNIVFPPVFLSGALVGIVEDVVDTVKGIYHVIVNFREMASAAIELISALFSKDGPRISRALGLEIGKEYANRITGMLKGNLFEFTYDLGKFIGPTIIYAILSALGFPELLAASIVTRIISILKPFLKRFPTLVRVAKKVASKLPASRRKHNVDPDLDDALGGQDLTGSSPQPGHAGGKAAIGGTDPGQPTVPSVGHQPPSPSTPQGVSNPPGQQGAGGGAAAVPKAGLPDISARFKSNRARIGDQIYETTKGELGIPGRVQTHRDVNAQRRVSQGIGEDAGHRIGNRFGAPGGGENLAPQNWKANRFGTFKRLEDDWEAKLKNGVRIEAEVTDITRVGENRPFTRKVKWTETASDGRVTQHELDYVNTHTPESRAKQNIPPTTSGQNGKVIDMEEARKRLRP